MLNRSHFWVLNLIFNLRFKTWRRTFGNKMFKVLEQVLHKVVRKSLVCECGSGFREWVKFIGSGEASNCRIPLAN